MKIISKSSKHNFSELNLIPTNTFSLDRDSLKLANHKLDKINYKLDNLQSSENSNFSNVVNHKYFTYFCILLFKLFAMFIGYKLVMKCKNRLLNPSRHGHERSTITNCITFNLCKKKNIRPNTPHNDVNIELNEQTDCMQVSENSETPLRRSSRLAKLKDSL